MNTVVARSITVDKNNQIKPDVFPTIKGHDSDQKNDSHLFREAVKGVTPLGLTPLYEEAVHKKKISTPPESTLKLRRKLASTEVDNKDMLSNHNVELVAPEAFISYCHPSISPALFKSLRTGMMPIEYILDLHGYTVEEARVTLIQFIQFCQNHHYRSVSVIHGKSHKNYENKDITLKSLVARWLTQLPAILAYASCLHKDGGRGAVYILLKRKR